MSDPGHGVAVWSSDEWQQAATSWLDDRLAASGIARTGEVEQPHLRPWATVLRIPTTNGPVWMKAAPPGTAFEAGLYELVARVAPGCVLTPIATDPSRGWILLPDGGPPIGEQLSGSALIDAMGAALARYGTLQRTLAPHVDELFALGVSDMRPAVMPSRFDDALAVTSRAIERDGRDADRVMHERVAAMRPDVVRWCEQLAASRLPASLDHNDLHAWNVLGDGGSEARFYDWGDSVVAHPFAAMLVPLGIMQRDLDAPVDDPRLITARDGYLDVFAGDAHGEDLVATLELAGCQGRPRPHLGTGAPGIP